jgi:hypothetical protein
LDSDHDSGDDFTYRLNHLFEGADPIIGSQQFGEKKLVKIYSENDSWGI